VRAILSLWPDRSIPIFLRSSEVSADKLPSIVSLRRDPRSGRRSSEVLLCNLRIGFALVKFFIRLVLHAHVGCAPRPGIAGPSVVPSTTSLAFFQAIRRLPGATSGL
jgi:hypothetical protein